MTVTRQDAINDALERLFDIGFTMEPGFSEHGPMVAEAISTLGRNEAVADWVELYKAKHRHIRPPPQQTPIDVGNESEWRGALGVLPRISDWLTFFRQVLEEAPWQETLRIWVPRLLPGYAGALTHGLIRTAHAVRGFPENAAPSALQRDELARGLALWAASYRRVAGDPERHGNLTPEEALSRLPRLAPLGRRDGLGDRGAAAAGAPLLDDLPGFASTVESVGSAADADAAISRHSRVFARLLLAHPELRPVQTIQLVHSITAPVAMRNLLPFVPEEQGGWVYRWLWQVSAFVVARVASPPATGSETDPVMAEPRLAPEELADRAVAHRDEHAIKLTEALLREDRRRPDPVYRAAAEAILQRLPRWT